MNEQEAKKLVRQTFGGVYDEEKFRVFIRNLFSGKGNFSESGSSSSSGQMVPESFREKIASYKRLAKFTDRDFNEIDILAVKLKEFTTLERARSLQRNFIARYLNGGRGGQLKDAALVAFYTDAGEWRFSFVKMQYQLDKENQKIRKDFTPARRSSFLVGEGAKTHTAEQQLSDVLQSDDITLSSIEKAFSIEPVTAEFFKEYRMLYEKLYRKLESADNLINKDGESIKPKDFAKHLLGQMVFIYFLQKKGWLGATEEEPFYKGKKDFLRWLYNNKDGSKDFYDDRLTYLLHEALAEKDEGKKANSFYYLEFECKIPYLNGGLFESFQGYDWKNTKLNLGNDIFDEILKVFDEYNFTVCEDEPLENEVAVDPEMLGKVFENLIDEHERKGSGTYYTPRKIVYYMCHEALIDYLHCSFPNIDHADIEDFVIHAEARQEHDAVVQEKRSTGQTSTVYKNFKIPSAIEKQASAMDKALQDIRVCDPASGSGAFLVGMMLEIVRLRLALNSLLKTPKNTHHYKKHCIENCLYGIDMDASAVDIACLRFWLSLAIDKDENTDKPDYVEPLPNLKYKIIEGNALYRSEIDLLNRNEFKDLEDKKKAYFKEENKDKKEKLSQDIDGYFKKFTGKYDFDLRVKFSEFFHEQKDGFDIVIANPPYIQLQKEGGKLGKEYEPYEYKSFAPTGDIYMLFYERAIELLRAGGRLAFITSNTWMRIDGGKKFRLFLVGKTTPVLLLDLGSNVFETATVDSNIMLLRNDTLFSSNEGGKRRTEFQAASCYEHKGTDLRKYVDENSILMTRPYEDHPWLVLSSSELKLLNKIRLNGVPLGKWNDVSIMFGIKTGYNEAFIIDTEVKERLIKEDPKSAEIIKPVLRGKDIKQWYPDWQDKWLITTFPSLKIKIDDYPAIKNALLSFDKDRLEQSGEIGSRKKTPHKWFETQDQINYCESFEESKIIYSEIVRMPQFYYDSKGYYFADATAFIMTGTPIKFLIAVLNSSVTHAIFAKFYAGGGLGNEGIRYKKKYLQELHIPEIPEAEQEPFIDLVNQITAITDDSEKSTADKIQKIREIQKQIDKMVIELYGLTAEEVGLLDKKLLHI